MHKEFSWGFEWKFQVDEVVYELTHSIEDDILRQDFRNFHRLWLRFSISFGTSSCGLSALCLTLCALTIVLACRSPGTWCAFSLAIWFVSTISTCNFFTRSAEKAWFHFAAYGAEPHRGEQASSSISKAHGWGVLCLLCSLLLILFSFFLRLDGVMELEIYESLKT